MILVLLLILLFSVGWWGWCYYTYTIEENSVQTTKQDNEHQITILEKIGDNILKTNENKFLDRPPSRRVEQSAPRKLDPQLNPLITKVIKITIGKYMIDDQQTIEYLKECLQQVLLSKTESTDAILAKYDPLFSNDLLVEACRCLYIFPLDDMKKLLVGQYIINKSMDNTEIDSIYRYIVSLANNKKIPMKTRMNAADILNLSNSSKYKQDVDRSLEILRRQADVPLPLPPTRSAGLPQRGTPQAAPATPIPLQIPKTERSIYSDGQNVHNTQVNDSVLESAKELIAKYRPQNVLTFNYDLIASIDETYKNKVHVALHRIATDSSAFKYGSTLYSIFQSLLNFIDQSPQKTELNVRLVQELSEMSGLCATGHMSRLINVLQGFDNIDPSLRIKISIDDEVYAKLKSLIEKAMQEDENSNEIVDDMTSDEKLVFVEFVKQTALKYIPEMKKEYTSGDTPLEEIKASIIKALDKYTGTSNRFNLIFI